MEKILQKTKQTANKAVKASNGKKTYVTALLFIIMALFGDKVPFLRDNQEIIREVLEYALELGVLHKAFRWLVKNFRSIKDWSINGLKNIVNKFKK